MLKYSGIIAIILGSIFAVYYQHQLIQPVLTFIQSPKSVPVPKIRPENLVQEDGRKIKDIILEKNLDYPPERLAFLAFKRERRMEVWQQHRENWIRLKSFPILGASGGSGPKLREGDHQVPEGVYRITWLNYNSAFHLSLKLNYPNAFDLKYARREGRQQPGSDIFIHGEDVSTGCLAMGNPAIEELFYLVKDTGRNKVQVIIAPYDFRRQQPSAQPDNPDWTPILYQRINQALASFPIQG